MTHKENMEAAIKRIDDLNLPEDTSKSRLSRPAKSEAPDDFASAADRIAAFWEKYPEGSILPEVDHVVVDDEQSLPYRVYTVRAFIRKHSDSDRPDAIAHATRGENDEDEVVRRYAQETAETSAISRALRNLGILPHGRPTADAAPEPATVDTKASPLAVAREAAGLSQKQLAEAMREAGISWSQAVVSKVENGNRALRAAEVSVLSELIGFKERP